MSPLGSDTRTRGRTTAENGHRPSPGGANAPGFIPHEPLAEDHLLGAAMLSPIALDVLTATVAAGDFYSPNNQHIAEAITALHQQGAPVDPTTVAVELRTHGHLDEVGGQSALVALQAATPAVTSAPRYADIVRSCAHRRRTIGLAADIAQNARDGTGIDLLLAELADLEATSGADELELEDLTVAIANPDDQQPDILTRGDGRHLLYRSVVNVIQAPPSVGKSWLALLAVVQILAGGGSVVYLDYEDSARSITARLVALGADPAAIIERFHYPRIRALTARGIAALPRLARTVHADLVVIDGVAEALSLQGHDENEAAAVIAWWTAIPRPLAGTGACVLLLDHVTKAREGRDRWARGSGAKLAAVDGVAYMLDPIEWLSRDKPGKLKLTVAKDRPGHIGAVGAIAAIVQINPSEQGARVAYEMQHPEGDGEWHGPTECMAAIRQMFIESPDLEIARSNIGSQLKVVYGRTWKDKTCRDAAETLALQGVLEVRLGARNGRFFRLHRDFQDDTKQHEEPELWEDF